MTVIPWARPLTPTRRGRRRKMIVDPLPQRILHHLVSDIPGPRDETEAERVVRFERQVAEVMHYRPRTGTEALIATHCVVMRLLEEGSRQDAARTDIPLKYALENARLARQFDKQRREMEKLLAGWQARPVERLNPAMLRALGIEPHLIPSPDEPENAEEPVSAVIVPLHPAPKMLQ